MWSWCYLHIAAYKHLHYIYINQNSAIIRNSSCVRGSTMEKWNIKLGQANSSKYVSFSHKNKLVGFGCIVQHLMPLNTQIPAAVSCGFCMECEDDFIWWLPTGYGRLVVEAISLKTRWILRTWYLRRMSTYEGEERCIYNRFFSCCCVSNISWNKRTFERIRSAIKRSMPSYHWLTVKQFYWQFFAHYTRKRINQIIRRLYFGRNNQEKTTTWRASWNVT